VILFLRPMSFPLNNPVVVFTALSRLSPIMSHSGGWRQ